MMRRKVLAWVLCLAMLAALVPQFTVSLAADVVASGNCGAFGDNVTWTLDSDGVLTISGTGSMKNDSTYSPFKNLSFTSVIIEDGVTQIGERSFYDCQSMTSITIPNSVTEIKSYAFAEDNGLTDVFLPDSITDIGRLSFANCGKLKSVHLPNGITLISEGAFWGCRKLESVTIPDSVTTIGYDAFQTCTSLKCVVFGKSVNIINGGAFLDCHQLIKIIVKSRISLGRVDKYGDSAFDRCEGLKRVFFSGSQEEWNGLDYAIPGDQKVYYNCTLSNMKHVNGQEPTCTQDGSREYWVDSGYYFTDPEAENEITEDEILLPALGHTSGEEVRIDEIAATCTKDGSYDSVFYCTVCDTELSRETVILPAFGHDWGSWEVTTPATCENAGIETRVCANDSKHKETREIAAKGHRWGSWKLTKPASCEEPGIETRVCANDENHTETRTIAATGHTPTDAVVENLKSATCTESGSYDSVVYCETCGEELYRDTVVTAAQGHEWGEWTAITRPSGKEERECSRCHEKEQRDHSLTAIPESPATCTENGTRAYWKCSTCNKLFSNEAASSVISSPVSIPALGHTWGAWTEVTPATESSTGLKQRECSRCHEKEQQEIPRLEHVHSLTKINSVAATCTEAGSEVYWKCQGCGKLFSDASGNNEISRPKTIPALGHNWGQWTVVTPATESGPGLETRECSRCHEKEQREIPQLTHVHNLTKVAEVPASCTRNGTQAYWKCSKCGKLFSDSNGRNQISVPITIEALGHNWGSWNTVTPATNTSPGKETRECSRCHEKENREIPALSGVGISDLSYRFGNSYSGFGYSSGYRIPYERYKMIFGDTQFARTYYNTAGTWGGNCFGMSSTSGMFFQKNNGVTTSEFSGGAGRPYDLGIGNQNSAWNISLREFIESMQISQVDYAVQWSLNLNKNHVAELCEAVSSFESSGQCPVLISVYGPQGGHALLGYKLDRSRDRLYVYDCNFPNTERYISLTKNASGNYSGWYYRLNDRYDWGSSYFNCRISFITYYDYYNVWTNRAERRAANMNLLTINSENAEIRDSNNQVIASVENGQVITDHPEVFQVMPMGITADEEGAQNGTTTVWLPTDLYVIKNNDDSLETFEASMIETDQSARVSTNGRIVLISVSDNEELNCVQVVSNNSHYEINLSSTLDSAYSEISLTGDTSDSPVAIAQSAGEIYADGFESVTAMNVDGEMATESIISGKIQINLVPDEPSKPSLSNFIKVQTYEEQFEDIATGAWYHDSVAKAYELGLVKGASPTNYNRRGDIKIGETIALACRIHSIYMGDGEEFAVAEGEKWYAPYVRYAIKNDIITEGEYEIYNVPATRSQFAAILAKALPAEELQAMNNVADNAIPDVSVTDAHAEEIYLLYRAGVLTGNDSYGTFTPDNPIKRSEVAAIIVRMAIPAERVEINLL